MPPAQPPTDRPRRRSLPRLRSGQAWPLAIAIGLGVVVLMNAVFVYVAVSNTDPIVESYAREHR